MNDIATYPIEKVDRYLALFGLSEHFSEEELVSSYHALAKLNHPDHNSDPESMMRMVIINDAYDFLRAQREVIAGMPRLQRADDPAYKAYRAAFSIMSEAFVGYYGESDKKLEGDLALLREKLTSAKSHFAQLIETYPSSGWTSDAIDRVFSINKWL
jgi:curved DNA-binding protein CbpA